ncbi:MAG: hypothetical protein IJX03_01420, partial [Clostridia bacterium]|nr:hypothetical protein [Clostridia bacterium]
MRNEKVISKQEYRPEVISKKSAFRFSRSSLCIPYGLFLALFVVLPLLLIVFYAFTDQSGAISFNNFIRFFTSATTLTTVIISIL